nr:neuronal acetylcholine receptor subunit beta-3 [Helicoverpa armigera]
MAVLTYILIIQLLNFAFGKQCTIDNTPDYMKYEKQLLEDLQCGYSAHHPPTANTTVKLTFFMRYFNFDSEEEVFSVQNWIHLDWQDDRLKWDPAEYHGLTETDVTYFDIWLPSIALMNEEDFLNLEIYSFYRCLLKSTGAVQCKHWIVHEAWCSVKLTDWPYDVQECSLEFEGISPHTENFTMVLDSYKFQISAIESAGWHVTQFKQIANNTGKSKITLIYVVVREAAGLSAIVISPAFVLTVLTILSLFLDVREKVRLAILSFSIVGHYYFLTELASVLPKECHYPPTLLYYYRASLVISMVIILLTVFLENICKFNKPHDYVKLINDFVYEWRFSKYIVFPQWDIDNNSKNSNEDWVKFSSLVNSVFIYVIGITYIGLYSALVPKDYNV